MCRSTGLLSASPVRCCDAAVRGAPSPLWLGLLDFAIGLVLLVLLAAALVAALHAVDWISRYTEGRELIDLPRRLLSLAQRPRDAENWWVYFALFSTLIPSALNLLIGMVSLVTVAFPLRRWLLATIPRLQKEGWDGTRKKVLAMLAAQSFVGVSGPLLAGWAVVAPCCISDNTCCSASSTRRFCSNGCCRRSVFVGLPAHPSSHRRPVT